MYTDWERRAKGGGERGASVLPGAIGYSSGISKRTVLLIPHPSLPKGQGIFCNMITGESQDIYL